MIKNFSRFSPFLVLLALITIAVWQIQKPQADYPLKKKFTGTNPFFKPNLHTSDERRIAKHFAVDTLPRLMQKGFIYQYTRKTGGTSIAVNGSLWKERSRFFKTSLLKEISIFNKVEGYELTTKIIDGSSGKLYAYISPDAKMVFYE